VHTGFIHKCIQLYETTVVRHGLMLVGPTGSGKTKVFLSIFGYRRGHGRSTRPIHWHADLF